jgi:predicted PhzF superfamily epimerase YddE/YHI9
MADPRQPVSERSHQVLRRCRGGRVRLGQPRGAELDRHHGSTCSASTLRARAPTSKCAQGDGIPEDPVCGSGNGSAAALVRRDGILTERSHFASRGRCVGRDGRVGIEFDDDTIWLGGDAVTCIEGSLKI